MREPTELEQKQYQRLREIFATARKRYLDAGGDPKRPGGSLNGQDCLTAEEKQEIVALGKQVFPLQRVKVKA
ncbi:hypothetical protein [Argonema antarcticum]|uniref:hypothetical protein n=1 Tax=Argonema antarcticum TaxID=2942763 RepID=UPI0020127213|nr:hypothetical protein [Argonema antarcticum]MCL1473778.1 hypothetical protein [Argonema antarcticum A004/B2]